MTDQISSQEEMQPGKIPEIISIVPVVDVALYPKMQLPLVVGQSQLIELVDNAMANDRVIGIIASKIADPQINHKPEDLFEVGTAAAIVKMAKGAPDKAQMLVQGITRFKIEEYTQEEPYLMARVTPLEDIYPKGKGKEIEALTSNLVTLFGKIVDFTSLLPPEMAEWIKTVGDAGTVADVVASTIQSTLEEKQKILETREVDKRLIAVTKMASHQLEILELGDKIQTQVKGDMDKNQRDYYLRQQLKAIQQELGEGDKENVEVQEYEAKIKEMNLPEAAQKEAERELSRLSRMHPSSAEYTVAATYLDWITSLPWHAGTEDNLDINEARKILDADHFGLQKPKKRILEYLAVRKLKPDSKGPIICLAGPPGTGKTSLGRSIARALGRNFVRISLGGVRDEAEIRGHRRTYVGALPGRIIQNIRRAESNNPIFMLDEVDKLGNDFRGDPSSALLEVLDPEQNDTFSDHYLDVPFDLSKVMFIATANILDTIPPALRDRMEVIELLGYTLEEKVKIAKKYLIPRQREAHGLKASDIKITDAAVKQIINGYTREAGLRNLEREIASVCRGVARKIAEGSEESVTVKPKELQEYIGPIKRLNEKAVTVKVPGVVNGLAWTPTGGEMLTVESVAMPGKKGLTLTGQLGGVMKESAQAALSFIRSRADKLKVDPEFFQEHEIHVHVPAGAIPKDGPSAGVTILTALTSLCTGKVVKKDVAMTGEITLRGQVLPVGGIKEKVLAAYRAGAKELILPKWNEKDLEDIPESAREKITFHFVDTMEQVLALALED
ncbi:ATP-dependent Lon protease [Desulfatibacillum alkenivorans DSM 16219]|jgi:ATP-dependent Lon protease|uniref:Lon protease n=1 Tax=Desulfatibacillum alkenivorans DSM 16219 TaxID=1121393 RepID=A0A1M6GKG3_9BACT|nr:endopeptidase La [Desulfatibacillum alkenivorans]SHJ10424.1 ATP-dependent Lon protease [Desulfatibacillum alkenivorans DSM 16219]